jgi:hypothetical protein
VPLTIPLPHITATPTAKPRKVLYENLVSIDPSLPRGASYAATLSLISDIHDDGVLPIDMRVIESNRMGGVRGEYSLDDRTLRISTKTPHPDITLIHELGHFIDRETSIFGGTNWASETQKSHKPWFSAVKKTAPYKQLKSYTETNPSWITPSLRRHYLYLFQPKEFWARSYQQFIANRSNHPGLKEQLELARRGTQGLSFWTPAEFVAIDLEMEKLFKSIKWMP